MMKMNQKNIAILAALGAALGAATAAGVLTARNRRRKELMGGSDKALPPKRNIYIAGGGLSGLSAAYYLIRDCRIPGDSIHIYEESENIGGAFNIGGDCESGFVCTPPKKLSVKNHANLMDMLSELRSANIPDMSVKDEITNFMMANPSHERARIIDAEGNVISNGFGLTRESVKRIKTLLKAKDYEVSEVSVAEFFIELPEFKDSVLWTLISTAYMLTLDSSAVELKHILNCIAGEIGDLFTMKNTLRAQYDLQETVIEALKIWLETHNVNFATHCRVTDADFDEETGNISAIHLDDNGTVKTYYLNKNDLVFITNGSVSECATIGDYNFPAPAPVVEPTSAALWRRLAQKRIGLGDPDVFYDGVDSEIVSFTITARSTALLDAICEFTGNDAVSGMLTTFKDSPWKLTISPVPQPYFGAQTDDITVICGYGVNASAEGRFIDKAMRYASGAEILFEIVKYLGIEERWDELTADIINVIPCALPYAGASALPFSDEEKPMIVTDNVSNFAFIGQFTKLGSGISSSSEYAVRTAREAVYRLTGAKKASTPPPKAVRTSYVKLFNALKK
ncbi:MAG: oleate hydratase [Clostridia bacterium]|nr:oleate hydratase [Clostridia bacterium]